MSNKSAEGKYLLSEEDIYNISARSMTCALKEGNWNTPAELLPEFKKQYASQFQPTEPAKEGEIKVGDEFPVDDVDDKWYQLEGFRLRHPASKFEVVKRKS